MNNPSKVDDKSIITSKNTPVDVTLTGTDPDNDIH